jgi:hypothetical protein
MRDAWSWNWLERGGRGSGDAIAVIPDLIRDPSWYLISLGTVTGNRPVSAPAGLPWRLPRGVHRLFTLPAVARARHRPRMSRKMLKRVLVGLKNAPERTFWPLAAVLVLLCAAATAASIARAGLGAEAAAWVQASGSIAAIIGATWLAGAEARRSRRSRRQEREEVAWGVRFALQQAKTECNLIAWDIVGTDASPKATDLDGWLLQTGISKTILRTYAARTDHAHPSIAHIASNGELLLGQLESELEQVCSRLSSGGELPEQLTNRITWYVGHFEQLLRMLDERMRGVRLAWKQGGDVLPLHDYDEWKLPAGATEDSSTDAVSAVDNNGQHGRRS